MQTVNLGDRLSFNLSQNFKIKCDKQDWNLNQSLVSKAINLIREETGCSKGAEIEINKVIPLASGLGGDSSNGAAILRGLNTLWGLGLPLNKLVDLAAQLGSDVPFFLHGGTALAQGRGEVITPLPPFPQMKVVLMVPPLPKLEAKTARLYQSLNKSHYTGGEVTDRLVAGLKGGEGLTPVLYNVFEAVSGDNFPGLKEYWQEFLKAGAKDVHLAGSGPALFTLIEDKTQAEDIYQHLQEAGIECYLTDIMVTGESSS